MTDDAIPVFRPAERGERQPVTRAEFVQALSYANRDLSGHVRFRA